MTRKELMELGVNFDNMKHPYGEMNIILQQFPVLKDDEESDDFIARPDVYMPRKNRVLSYGETYDGFDLSDMETRLEYIAHLKDSAERHKIMAILLAKQAQELEEFGEIRTTCYYPECDYE